MAFGVLQSMNQGMERMQQQQMENQRQQMEMMTRLTNALAYRGVPPPETRASESRPAPPPQEGPQPALEGDRDLATAAAASI